MMDLMDVMAFFDHPTTIAEALNSADALNSPGSGLDDCRPGSNPDDRRAIRREGLSLRARQREASSDPGWTTAGRDPARTTAARSAAKGSLSERDNTKHPPNMIGEAVPKHCAPLPRIKAVDATWPRCAAGGLTPPLTSPPRSAAAIRREELSLSAGDNAKHQAKKPRCALLAIAFLPTKPRNFPHREHTNAV